MTTTIFIIFSDFFTKFSFHRKWNDVQLLLINMVYTSCLTRCQVGRRKLILSIYINRSLHRARYQNPTRQGPKPPAQDLGTRPKIWARIPRPVCKSPVDTPGPDTRLQEPQPRICSKNSESQDPRPRVPDARPDIRNSDIRQDVVISYGRKLTYFIFWFEKQENLINIYFPFYTVELKVEWPLGQRDSLQLFLL